LRTSKAIGLYAVAVVLLGALFAPWLFWALQALAGHIPAFGSLARQPFHRIFDRALLIVAFVGLWPLLRYAGFRSWGDVGYVKARGWWRHVLLGFVLGLGSLALVIAVTVLLGTRTLNADKSAGQMLGAFLRYLLTGIVVALIEETFFRGALQGAFQRGMKVGAAVILASVIYSALHFVKPSRVIIPPDQVTWSSGFTCLGGVASRSFGERDVLVGFVTLFLAGCILGLAYARTKALYLSIGLHAGWVLANEFARWLGAGRIIEDKLSWVVLAVLLVLVAWLCRNKLKPLRDPGPSRSGGVALST
jgi:membrane protease YdiL (CAAX protease family)